MKRQSKKQQQTTKKRMVSLGLLTEQDKKKIIMKKTEERRRKMMSMNDGSDVVNQSDFVTAMLARLTLTQLLRFTKLLLFLMNRVSFKSSTTTTTDKEDTDCLYHIQHNYEYNDTIFSEYAMLDYFGENDIIRMPFREYYNMIYQKSKNYSQQVPASEQTTEGRIHHARQLRACFLIALVHDRRIKRFVFSRHDIHYHYLRTTPTCSKKGLQFIEQCKQSVNRVFHNDLAILDMCDECVNIWDDEYRFIGSSQHTVQRPSASNTMEVST
jgi:hypothetical protein